MDSFQSAYAVRLTSLSINPDWLSSTTETNFVETVDTLLAFFLIAIPWLAP